MTPKDLLDQAKTRSIKHTLFLKYLWEISKGLQRTARGYEANQVRMFRIRKWDNNKPLPTQIENLWYPPLNRTVLQRASDVGEQVFYASAGMPTTLVEGRVTEGDYFIVSEWENTDLMVLPEVGFIDVKDITNNIENLYHELFTWKGEDMYIYSSKVGSHLMQGSELAGLIYPSIISGNKSENIVLKKQFIDDGKLRFINASYYFIKKKHDDMKYDADELNFATELEGRLLDWKDRKRQWQLRKKNQELKFVSNGWAWNAFDTNGNRVDPE